MSDENTTPRRVAPEGPVPEDHVHEPVAADGTDGTGSTDGTDAPDAPDALGAPDTPDTAHDTLLLEQHPPTTELPAEPVTAMAEPSVSPAEPVLSTAVPLDSPAPLPVPSPVDRASSADVVTPPGGLVTVRTGPRPGAIVLGLLCLLVAAYTMARQTTGWRFDLNLVGPISIGALGTLLLLVGLVGLLSRGRS